MRNKAGFSLIEIMIVTAIMVLLAGIGFSVSAPAREQARQTTCISNVKQIYQIWSLYTADYPGLTYPGTEMAHMTPTGVYYAYELDKEHDYMFCPDSKGQLRPNVGSSYALMFVTDIWSMPQNAAAKLMVKELETQMKAAARALEFEKAAGLRDQVVELRRELVGSDDEELKLMAEAAGKGGPIRYGRSQAGGRDRRGGRTSRRK